MIRKVVTKESLSNHDSIMKDLDFWLNQPPEKRLEAVELLRRQKHGNTARLQRSVRVIKRPQIVKKDLADLEALGEE